MFFVFNCLLSGSGRLLAAMPAGVLAAICRVLGWLVATVPGKRRRALRANLHHAFPEKSEAWRRQIALESARRSIEMGFFVLASPHFSEKRLREQFILHDDLRQLFRDLKTTPGPLMVLSPHFTLMEANTFMPMLVGEELPPIGIIYRPFDFAPLETWVKRTRERWGVRLLSRKEGYFQAVDLLRHNGAVGLLYDQNAGSRGALSLLFDRVCSSSELAGILAEKCRTRVVFIYVQRRGFMRAITHGEYLDVAQKSEEVLFATNRWLENKLRESDDICADWLWLHNRWRHQDSPTRRFRLESKRNLLAEQLSWQGQTALPRRTRFFIRLPNWLGDVVMALPLLRALRHSRPDAELTLLAQPALLPLLERLNMGDRLLALPPRGPAYWAFFRRLREEYPDVQVLFTNSWRGDLEAWLADAPQRFGMIRPGKWRPLLTHAWPVSADCDETKIHQTLVWEKFFRHFGLEGELDLTPFAWATPANRAGLNIGFICGTENSPEKRWPVKRWQELIHTIMAVRPDARPMLFGTARDAAITAAVAEGLPSGQLIDLSGKTNLVEFAEALTGCAVVVCNDTGGMHLANLLGVPVVAVYGPTNPVRTGPIFAAPRVIVQPDGCPPTGDTLLESLPPERVFEALKPWLAHTHD